MSQHKFEQELDKFRKILPHQGPLGVFIHQNTLQFLEHEKFDDALKKGAKYFGAETLPSFEFFQKKINEKRLILKFFSEELDASAKIPAELHENFFTLLTRPCFQPDRNSIQWEIKHNLSNQEKNVFAKLKAESVANANVLPEKMFKIHSNYNFEENLISTFSSILDQGIRFIGPKKIQKNSNINLLLQDELARLQISSDDTFDFLCQAAKGFLGWLGMIELYDHHPEMFPRELPNHFSLEEALVLRLKIIHKVEVDYLSVDTSLHLEATIIECIRCSRLTKQPIDKNIISITLNFDNFSRRLLCLKAFERQFRETKLQEIIEVGRTQKELGQTPKYQALFCLDEREESLRRHLEKNSSERNKLDFETFGVAGFFGIDFLHADEDRRRVNSLCPIQVVPSLQISSKNSVFNLESAGLDCFAIAQKVSTILRLTGLRRSFSRLVFIVGHGSTTTNNTHFSAYECGACGGQKGFHNARVYCQMINRADVREALKKFDIFIPAETWFVASYHDTSLDDVIFYDEKHIPETHHAELQDAKNLFAVAARENALERCIRLEDFQPKDSASAKNRVEKRAHSIAQARPEYGHATNALFMIGPRYLSKSIFFDRRCFLFSYDPNQDSTGQNIMDLLQGAVPVTAGISLEYYFSTVDNEVFGCGSKASHNIHGLYGVSNGAYSDLRTGLPLQTVEIHEPMRVLVIVFAKKEFVETAIKDHPLLIPIVKNEWIQTVVVEPETFTPYFYSAGTFQKITTL